MNQTHIHLLITHLPIFGSILGSLALVHGLWTKTRETLVAAYYIFIISSIGAGIAYTTGEAAEETIENLSGAATGLIEQHEDFAVIALTFSIILGAASLGVIYLTARKPEKCYLFGYIMLVLALVNFGIAGRTGYLGGQIRHTEIANTNATQPENNESQDED